MDERNPAIFEFGPFRLDVGQKTLSSDASDIKLPPKTLELLIYFVKNPNKTIAKATLMSEVWPETFVEEANLSVHVSMLRKVLVRPGVEGTTEKVVSIETYPRVGYRFSANVTCLTPPENTVEMQPVRMPPVKASNRHAISVFAVLLAAGAFLAWSALSRPAPSPQPLSQDNEAREFYERGMQYRVRSGNENIKLALESYTKAYTLDPGFAKAYAAAAEMYELLANNGAVDPAVAHPKAIAAITKALEIDPQLAEGHRVLSVIKTNEWEWVAAEEAILKAIDLERSSARSRQQYARLLAVLGRYDAALNAMREAEAADPMNLRLKETEGAILVYAGQYEEALRVFNDIEALESASMVDFELGWIEELRGNYDAAILHIGSVLQRSGDDSVIECYLGYALARSGRRAEARELLRKLQTSPRYVSPATLAFFYIGFDDSGAALDLLEKAYSEHDLQLKFLTAERIYDPISAEPRFIELVRKVGLRRESAIGQ
jgi:DNA-binding winged helix-turn-helix (wHTH) protein/tetratricopeptide (TPR) repeat protein